MAMAPRPRRPPRVPPLDLAEKFAERVQRFAAAKLAADSATPGVKRRLCGGPHPMLRSLVTRALAEVEVAVPKRVLRLPHPKVRIGRLQFAILLPRTRY